MVARTKFKFKYFESNDVSNTIVRSAFESSTWKTQDIIMMNKIILGCPLWSWIPRILLLPRAEVEFFGLYHLVGSLVAPLYHSPLQECPAANLNLLTRVVHPSSITLSTLPTAISGEQPWCLTHPSRCCSLRRNVFHPLHAKFKQALFRQQGCKQPRKH
jgi:hypothetical protein